MSTLALNLGDFFSSCFKMRLVFAWNPETDLFMVYLIKTHLRVPSWYGLGQPLLLQYKEMSHGAAMWDRGQAHCVNFTIQSPKMSKWMLSALSYWLYYLVHFYFKGEFYWGWLYQNNCWKVSIRNVIFFYSFIQFFQWFHLVHHCLVLC